MIDLPFLASIVLAAVMLAAVVLAWIGYVVLGAVLLIGASVASRLCGRTSHADELEIRF